jgi:hypothetical protein
MLAEGVNVVIENNNLSADQFKKLVSALAEPLVIPSLKMIEGFLDKPEDPLVFKEPRLILSKYLQLRIIESLSHHFGRAIFLSEIKQIELIIAFLLGDVLEA